MELAENAKRLGMAKQGLIKSFHIVGRNVGHM